MTQDQISKIRSDLQITQQNMSIFSEMLTELNPGKEHPQDKSLFDQLHATCRAMQTRLVELIDQVDDDKLTADLLEINDNMNNLFLRYDRYEKNKCQNQGAIRRTQPAGGHAVPSPRPVSEAPLIDFGSSTESAVPPGTTAIGPTSLVKIKDEDVDKLADWMGDRDEGGTTAEFDMFLAERAAATDNPKKPE